MRTQTSLHRCPSLLTHRYPSLRSLLQLSYTVYSTAIDVAQSENVTEDNVTTSSANDTTMASASHAIPQESQGNQAGRQEPAGTTHGIRDILGQKGLRVEETQQQE